MPLHCGVITLLPELFEALNFGVTGRAIKEHLATLSFWNPRDFTQDKHRTVDDKPYGGGPGMLMKVAPLRAAIQAAKENLPNAKVVYLSPQGKPFDQATAEAWSQQKELILVAGRYEGIDERLLLTDIDEECSIGDYVLSGGEFAACVVIDSLVRLLPGALGDDTSAAEDSFSAGLLDHPHYTRPESIGGLNVPETLLSGHHEDIKTWRLQQALGKTWLKRPDLLTKKSLSDKEKSLLQAFISEYTSRSKTIK